MSRSGPNTLIVVGDTDWWDLTTQAAPGVEYSLTLDSRLRSILVKSNAVTGWDFIRSAGSRRAIAGGYYLEVALPQYPANSHGQLGIVPVGATGLTGGPLSNAGTFGHSAGREFHENGVV